MRTRFCQRDPGEGGREGLVQSHDAQNCNEKPRAAGPHVPEADMKTMLNKIGYSPPPNILNQAGRSAEAIVRGFQCLRSRNGTRRLGKSNRKAKTCGWVTYACLRTRPHTHACAHAHVHCAHTHMHTWSYGIMGARTAEPPHGQEHGMTIRETTIKDDFPH